MFSYAKRSLSRHSRLLLHPIPQQGFVSLKNIKWGAIAAYCCARLLVARANRAVIVFAFLRCLSQPFSAVVVVFAPFLPQCAHTTTSCYYPSKCRRSFASLRSVPTLHSAHSVLHLPNPKHLRGKKLRQPCVFNVGSQRPHSATLRSGFLYLPPSLHSQRLAPLPRSSGQILRCATQFAHLLSVGSGLLYLLCFCFAHAQPPTTHP